MSVSLDPPRRVGGLMVAALSRTVLGPVRLGPGFAVAGSKEPLAILIAEAGAVRALAPDGRPLEAAEVEALCPGALARMAAFAAAP